MASGQADFCVLCKPATRRCPSAKHVYTQLPSRWVFEMQFFWSRIWCIEYHSPKIEITAPRREFRWEVALLPNIVIVSASKPSAPTPISIFMSYSHMEVMEVMESWLRVFGGLGMENGANWCIIDEIQEHLNNPRRPSVEIILTSLITCAWALL